MIYAIREGNADGIFMVDPHTGQVRTMVPLAYAADSYNLRVTATDRGHPANTATLTLTLDINPALNSPSPPSLTFTVPENSAPGTVAGTLPPESGQAVLSHTITSGNYRAAFSVSTRPSGEGVLEVSGSLDRETYPEYQLVVAVEVEGGEESSVGVEVWVSDVNDHVPEFSTAGLNFPVVENLAAGNTVASLQVMAGGG